MNTRMNSWFFCWLNEDFHLDMILAMKKKTLKITEDSEKDSFKYLNGIYWQSQTDWNNENYNPLNNSIQPLNSYN